GGAVAGAVGGSIVAAGSACVERNSSSSSSGGVSSSSASSAGNGASNQGRTLYSPTQRPVTDSIAKMTCGVVCLATLSSFLGTVLDGIGRSSMGQVLGCDPTKMGATLIALWWAINGTPFSPSL